MFGHIPRNVRAAVDDATRAASIHNSQPWIFVFRGDAIDLWLDIGRAPHVVDPAGRWALQSAGAALANLELALAHRLGSRVSVTTFPTGPATPPKGLVPITRGQLPPALRALTGLPVATVTWAGGPAEPSAPEEALYGAIEHRYTSRAPFAATTLNARQWQDITTAGACGTVSTDQATEDFARAFLKLTAEVEARMVDDVAYLAEIKRWVDRGPREGIPSGATGVRDTSGRYPGRDFSVGPDDWGSALPEGEFEGRLQLAVIHSDLDSPADWLDGGRVLERVGLRATASGLRMGILGQAIEQDETHRAVSEEYSVALGRPVVVQQVVRLGYGDGSPRPAATPRRRLEDVLVSGHE
ncbi:Acg family FMN-binding oxidoreductase [Nakamurella sp.]|uniref:Acg family FMN-binding oxidoreductase n=1 Tax=Nakamurella sp. TaxID=1869182 RepID=UPI0037844EB2